ncbi:MAG: Fatty acid desaturase; Delta-9 fatty acid desaturase, partial [uncultured Solirubrobacteraceae bacterium]
DGAHRRRHPAQRQREARSLPHGNDHGGAAPGAGPRGHPGLESEPPSLRPRRLRRHVLRHGLRHHDRLPPDAHPPGLRDQPPREGAVRDPRLGRDRGARHLLGGRPPQAPRLHRPRRRSPQPARRPRPRRPRHPQGPLSRARRLAVRSHAARGEGPLRGRPHRRPGDLVGQPDVLPLGRRGPARAVRARLGDRRLGGARPDRPAVGWRGAHARAAPRDLLDQLALPRVRLPPLRHRRRVAQPDVAGPAGHGRELPQQPSRLPDLRAPRARPRPARLERRGHRPDGTPGPGVGREAPERGTAGQEADRGV